MSRNLRSSGRRSHARIHQGIAQLLADRVRAFRQGLSEAGYFEAVLTSYFSLRRPKRLAAGVGGRSGPPPVAVIATGGAAATLAAKAATATIPIVAVEAMIRNRGIWQASTLAASSRRAAAASDAADEVIE